MSFPNKLRELRRNAGLTQTELAKRARLSRGGIAQIESGTRLPGWATVQKLAAALGVSVDAFNDGSRCKVKVK